MKSQSGLRYAVRWERSTAAGTLRIIPMHRVIMGVLGIRGPEVDHQNHDGLDNQRSNLRVVTHAQNLQNKRGSRNSTSVYRGVYWRADKQRWIAKARLNGRCHHIGAFRDEREAAQAVAEWRRQNMPFAVETAVS